MGLGLCGAWVMREHPIMFSAPMVRAILDGKKTQTRRVVKAQPEIVEYTAPFGWNTWCFSGGDYSGCGRVVCSSPYGDPGDRLWVREGFSEWADDMTKTALKATEPCLYRADYTDTAPVLDIGGCRWKSPLYMGRSYSRIDLLVKSVRVQRLQEITEADAVAEGVDAIHAMTRFNCAGNPSNDVIHAYRSVWDSINARKHPWASNPWVWVVEFERVKP